MRGTWASARMGPEGWRGWLLATGGQGLEGLEGEAGGTGLAHGNTSTLRIPQGDCPICLDEFTATSDGTAQGDSGLKQEQ